MPKGYQQKECSSDFNIAGSLTESILMGNLAIRSFDIRKKHDDQWNSRPLHQAALGWGQHESDQL